MRNRRVADWVSLGASRLGEVVARLVEKPAIAATESGSSTRRSAPHSVIIYLN
jgi:hypothetical protein